MTLCEAAASAQGAVDGMPLTCRERVAEHGKRAEHRHAVPLASERTSVRIREHGGEDLRPVLGEALRQGPRRRIVTTHDGAYRLWILQIAILKTRLGQIRRVFSEILAVLIGDADVPVRLAHGRVSELIFALQYATQHIGHPGARESIGLAAQRGEGGGALERVGRLELLDKLGVRRGGLSDGGAGTEQRYETGECEAERHVVQKR